VLREAPPGSSKTLPTTHTGPLQFAYRQKNFTEEAITTALHSALSHFDNKNTYVRMLIIDFNSAFNIVIPA